MLRLAISQVKSADSFIKGIVAHYKELKIESIVSFAHCCHKTLERPHGHAHPPFVKNRRIFYAGLLMSK